MNFKEKIKMKADGRKFCIFEGKENLVLYNNLIRIETINLNSLEVSILKEKMGFGIPFLNEIQTYNSIIYFLNNIDKLEENEILGFFEYFFYNNFLNIF